MLLGYESEHLTPAQNSGAVIQLAAHTQRQADQHDSLQLGRLTANRLECIQCAVQQRLLQKQVAAGVTGQAKLGEYDQARALRSCLLCLLYDFGSVIGAVRYAQIGRCGSDFDKSILHSSIPPDNSDMVSIPFFTPIRKGFCFAQTANDTERQKNAVLFAEKGRKDGELPLGITFSRRSRTKTPQPIREPVPRY